MFEPEEMTTSRLVPPHQVRDRTLLKSLTDAMMADGWVGRPLLGWESPDGYVRLFTGSHRHAAAAAADVEPPVALVDVPEGLIEADGEDVLVGGQRLIDDDSLQALLEEHDPEAAALLRREQSDAQAP